MSDFINSIQPRKSAIQANKDLLENTSVTTNVTTDITTKEPTNIATNVTTKEPTNIATNVTTKEPTNIATNVTTKKNEIKNNNSGIKPVTVSSENKKIKFVKKDLAQQLTIRITNSRKKGIDKVAKEQGVTRQEVLNRAIDNLLAQI